MAYVPQQQSDEDKRKAEAGGGAMGSFGSTQGAGAPTQPKFVNVAEYLSKNPEGSANIGNAASAKLEQQRNDASSAVGDSNNKFTQDVNAGTTNLDQGVLDSALSSPENFVQDPNNTAKFLAMRDASYKGPSSLQGTEYFSPTDSKVSGLQTTAAGLGTEAGRTNLVSSLSDHPTQGKSSLNQLLLQGNPGAAQKIQDTAGTFKSVEDQWNQILANAPAAASAARATTDATRATTQAKLGDATQGFTAGLNAKLGTANNARSLENSNYQNIEKSLNTDNGYTLTQKQLDDLGIGQAQPYLSKLHDFNKDLGMYEGPVNLSGFIGDQGSANTNIPTLGGVANSNDYAREAALQKLSGMDLGLADTPETAYASNSRLPGQIDYMGAFGKGGSSLKTDELGTINSLKGVTASQLADPNYMQRLNTANQHFPTTQEAHDPNSGLTTRPDLTPYDASKDYYTNPAATAVSTGQYTMAPAPQGWNPNTPVPYPQPTSNPPGNVTNPIWDPYQGVWSGGVQLGTPGGGFSDGRPRGI